MRPAFERPLGAIACAAARLPCLAIAVFGPCLACGQDSLTPSRGASGELSAAVAGPRKPAPTLTASDFTTQQQALRRVATFQLEKYDQARAGSFLWRGTEDCSLRADVGLSGEMLVVRGEFTDDRPFVQVMAAPAQAGWWRIPYGADGLVLSLDAATTNTLGVQLALNWSSGATASALDRLKLAFPGKKPEPSALPYIDLKPIANPGATGAAPRFAFAACIRLSDLAADPALFDQPLRVCLEMHDVDGDLAEYKSLEDGALLN